MKIRFFHQIPASGPPSTWRKDVWEDSKCPGAAYSRCGWSQTFPWPLTIENSVKISQNHQISYRRLYKDFNGFSLFFTDFGSRFFFSEHQGVPECAANVIFPDNTSIPSVPPHRIAPEAIDRDREHDTSRRNHQNPGKSRSPIVIPYRSVCREIFDRAVRFFFRRYLECLESYFLSCFINISYKCSVPSHRYF